MPLLAMYKYGNLAPGFIPESLTVVTSTGVFFASPSFGIVGRIDFSGGSQALNGGHRWDRYVRGELPRAPGAPAPALLDK